MEVSSLQRDLPSQLCPTGSSSSLSLSTRSTGSGKLLLFLHFPCQSHSQFSSLSSSPRRGSEHGHGLWPCCTLSLSGQLLDVPLALQGSERSLLSLHSTVTVKTSNSKVLARFLLPSLALKAFVSLERRSRPRHLSDPGAAGSSPRERWSSRWSSSSL